MEEAKVEHAKREEQRNGDVAVLETERSNLQKQLEEYNKQLVDQRSKLEKSEVDAAELQKDLESKANAAEERQKQLEQSTSEATSLKADLEKEKEERTTVEAEVPCLYEVKKLIGWCCR